MDLYGGMLSSELCTLIKEFLMQRESLWIAERTLFLKQEHNEGEK